MNNYVICQQVKYERHPPLIKLELTPTLRKPFETVHVDTFKFDNVITLQFETVSLNLDKLTITM